MDQESSQNFGLVSPRKLVVAPLVSLALIGLAAYVGRGSVAFNPHGTAAPIWFLALVVSVYAVFATAVRLGQQIDVLLRIPRARTPRTLAAFLVAALYIPVLATLLAWPSLKVLIEALRHQ